MSGLVEVALPIDVGQMGIQKVMCLLGALVDVLPEGGGESFAVAQYVLTRLTPDEIAELFSGVSDTEWQRAQWIRERGEASSCR